MTIYVCDECFGKTQKPCVVIIPGDDMKQSRTVCVVTPHSKRGFFREIEETQELYDVKRELFKQVI